MVWAEFLFSVQPRILCGLMALVALGIGRAVHAQNPPEGWTPLGTDGAGQDWSIQVVDLSRHPKLVEIRFRDGMGVGDRHRERIDCARRTRVTVSYNGIPIPDETENLLPTELVDAVLRFACRG